MKKEQVSSATQIVDEKQEKVIRIQEHKKAVDVKNLSVFFSSNGKLVKAVDDISFSVKTGEFFGIVGESGSGKTTTARTMLGLYNRQNGSIGINQRSIPARSNAIKGSFNSWMADTVQMIFQDPFGSVNTSKKIFDIIAEGLLNKNDFKDKAKKAYRYLKLEIELLKAEDLIKDEKKRKDTQNNIVELLSYYRSSYKDYLFHVDIEQNKILSAHAEITQHKRLPKLEKKYYKQAISAYREKERSLFRESLEKTRDNNLEKKPLDATTTAKISKAIDAISKGFEQERKRNQERAEKLKNNITTKVEKNEFKKHINWLQQYEFEKRTKIIEAKESILTENGSAHEALTKVAREKYINNIAKYTSLFRQTLREQIVYFHKNKQKHTRDLKIKIEKSQKEIERLHATHYKFIKKCEQKLNNKQTRGKLSSATQKKIREITKKTKEKHSVVNRNKQIRQKVYTSMRDCGLNPAFSNNFPSELSGGQMQRVGIARALVVNPSILIADEPISALDVSVQAQVINLLKDLQEKYKFTIILIAHDLRVVEYVCDRLVVMYNGKIVEKGTSKEIFSNTQHPYTKNLMKSLTTIQNLKEQKSNYFDELLSDHQKYRKLSETHFVLE